MWYINVQDGITEFPIYVKIQAYRHDAAWLIAWVPDKIKIEVLAADCTTLEVPTWLCLADYHVLGSEGLGTTISVTGHAAVSGSFGDGEGYSIGGSIGVSWSADTTDTVTHNWSNTAHTEGSYRYLGYATVDANEQAGTSQWNWGVVMVVGVGNGPAHLRDGHWIYILVKVTTTFREYLVCWPYTAYYTKDELHSFLINNDPSSTDAKLYLLLAQDYDYTIT
jgi:hypothetical protein